MEKRLAIVISCLALYFSIFSYVEPYNEAAERVRFNEAIAISRIDSYLRAGDKNEKFICEQGISEAKRMVERYEDIVESERSNIKSQQYKCFYLTTLTLKNNIKSAEVWLPVSVK